MSGIGTLVIISVENFIKKVLKLLSFGFFVIWVHWIHRGICKDYWIARVRNRYSKEFRRN